MRKTTWKDGLLTLHQTLEALKEKQLLRHGSPLVYVSDISEQYYCEKKVELSYKLGAVKTQAMQEGTMLHEEITKMEKATLQRIIEGIAHSPYCSARFPLVAEVEGLPVVGVPDIVGFIAGTACFVLELKTFGARIFRLYSSQVVQAKVYGLLLDAMGFDCSKLLLYIVGIRRGMNAEVSGKMLTRLLFTLALTPEVRNLSKTVYISKDQIMFADDKRLAKLFRLEKQAVKKFVDLVSAANLSIFCLPYSRDDALESLKWAKGYWFGDRDAVPTRKQAKCRVCDFAENCPDA
ncbi:MAG: hypothetical protein QXU99_02550 [Candidatus Bathyarchaeia archaeon]